MSPVRSSGGGLDLPPYQPTSVEKQQPEKNSKRENAATILGAIASIVVGGGISAVQGVSTGLPVGVFLLVIVASIRIVVYLIQFSIDKLSDEVNRQGEVNDDLRTQINTSSHNFDEKLNDCEKKCAEIQARTEAELLKMRTLLLSRNRVILRLALAVKELGGDIDPTKFVFGENDEPEEGTK